MRILSVIVLRVSIIVLLAGTAGGKGWHGIVPLHSTRADVERIWGRPERPGSISVYRTKDGLTEVRYATSPCKGRVLGWDVPRDTVLELHVAPREKEKGKIDLSRFVMARGHTARPYYVNLEEGLGFELMPDGEVYAISYLPSGSDNRLRCPGFPQYDGGLDQYHAFDSFADIPNADQEAILDNFAFTLENDPSSIGYIIVYAGRRARVNEAKIHAEQAKDYLANKRRIDSRRLKAVDGGYREKLATELYVVPSDMPPPTPTPTLPSNEVQIVRTTARNKRRSSKTRYKYDHSLRLRSINRYVDS